MSLDKVKPVKIDINLENGENVFFTSDLHFGHRNILEFCKRPFASVEEMDEALIENWNSVCEATNDWVFDLGDFCILLHTGGGMNFWADSKWEARFLYLGNHDITRWPGDKVMELFHRVEQQMILKIDGRYVYLNHYPFLCYGGAWRDPGCAVYALHGHVHSGPNCGGKDCDRLNLRFPYQYDVGVDNNNYTPVSWEQVKEIIDNQVRNGLPNTNNEHTIPDEAYKE